MSQALQFQLKRMNSCPEDTWQKICMIELCLSLVISNSFVGQGQETLIQSSNYWPHPRSEVSPHNFWIDISWKSQPLPYISHRTTHDLHGWKLPLTYIPHRNNLWLAWLNIISTIHPKQKQHMTCMAIYHVLRILKLKSKKYDSQTSPKTGLVRLSNVSTVFTILILEIKGLKLDKCVTDRF